MALGNLVNKPVLRSAECDTAKESKQTELVYKMFIALKSLLINTSLTLTFITNNS